MSTNLRNTAFICYALMCGMGMAHGQPVAHVDPFLTFAVNQSTQGRQKSQVEAALSAKESREADADPEGNWGEPINGFQLSVRLEKKLFALGETIMADTYLRNVSDAPLTQTIANGKGFESKLCRFIVTRDGREPVKRVGEQRIFSVKQSTLYPRAQWKCPVRLNEMFQMNTPGTYLITGVTGSTRNGVVSEIRSGNVLIEIVAQTAAAVPDSQDAPSLAANSIRADSSPSGNNSSSPEASPAPDRTIKPKVHPLNNSADASLDSVPSTPSSVHTTKYRISAGLIVGLVALVLAILWRAARRKATS